MPDRTEQDRERRPITMSCDATLHAVSCALHFVCGGSCYSHMLYAVSFVLPVVCIMLVCCLLHLVLYLQDPRVEGRAHHR